MKAILVTGAICAVIGAATGWMNAADHYEAKARREQDAYAKTLAEVNQRVEHYQTISEEYYADYQEALTREPTTVTERVFVRASCKTDAAADTGGVVGDATATERVELHSEAVRSATAVTDQAERDVQSCRAALHSLQRKIRLHNSLQSE